MGWAGEVFVSGNDNSGDLYIKLTNFADGSAALKVEHQNFLVLGTTDSSQFIAANSVLDKLTNGAKFRVVGFASSDGGANDDYNRRLAWQRAFAVCDFLRGGDGSGQPSIWSKYDPDNDSQLELWNKVGEVNNGVVPNSNNDSEYRAVAIYQRGMAYNDKQPAPTTDGDMSVASSAS
jgi:hypothetical protein